MKQVWKMLLAALLCLSMLPPVTGTAEEAAAVYGVCLADRVNVRKQAGTDAKIWFKINQGHVAQILDVQEKGDEIWYKINTEHPTPNGRTYIGYIMDDFFRVMSQEETESYLAGKATPKPVATPKVTPTAAPTLKPSVDDGLQGGSEPDYAGQEVLGATGVILVDANFRTLPSSSKGELIAVIPEGAVVTVNAIPLDDNGWYRVSYDGSVGYVFSAVLEMQAAGETPTPAPGFGTEVTDVFGVVTADDVNLRAGAGKDTVSLGKLDEGTEVEILTIPDQISSSHWYRVRYLGQVGYIQSNFIRVKSDASEENTEPPTEEEDEAETTPPLAVVTATGVITADGVNFRVGAGLKYSTIGKLNSDTVVELLSMPGVIDADHWYRIRYNGQTGYVQAPYIRILTLDESMLPDVSLYGFAKLKETSANLREKPGGPYILLWKGKGSMLRIVGEPVTKGSFDWYPVYYQPNATIYYVRNDVIKVVLADGSEATPSPTPTLAPNNPYGYIITTDTGVHLRIKPDSKDSIAQVPINTILACVGESLSPSQSGTSYTWYHVFYNGMYGYLRGDCVRVCTVNGGSIAPTPTPEPEETSAPTQSTTGYGYIRLIKDNVNLRVEPLKASQGWLPLNLILPVIGPVVPEDEYGKYCWYEVRTADGRKGYIRGDCAVPCDYEGDEITPAPAPTSGAEVTGVTARIIKNANFRKEASTSSDIFTVIRADTIVTVLAIPSDRDNGWYRILYNGQAGYVPASYLTLLTTDGETPTAEPTEDPTPTPGPIGDPDLLTSFIITTHDKVNVRSSYSMDSQRIVQLPKRGVVLPYMVKKDIGTVTWYNILYNNENAWIHGDYVRIMTVAEYQQWLLTNPDDAPDLADNIGYVRLTSDKVYIRSEANGSVIIDQLAKGTVLRYYREGIGAGNYNWYRVLTPDGLFGYIRSDMVEKCTAQGDALPTPTPGSSSSRPSSGQEADYTTLKLGSSGTGVLTLVAELINQGYYSGAVTSDYTTAVQDAVKAFQRDNGLTVDGIAGDATQHALFGTKPVGSGDTTNLDFTIYPAEKIDWYTGGIQDLLPRGANFKVYDVKTGIVWWAHRWAGARHADIETLTAADSARLCQIYGVSDLQEIVDRNLWQRRPCLVTIGTRTFAASLDGMVHNPDGDTISNNNMKGQICMHFTNSEGHASQTVSTSHAEAIEYAYKHCPAGQK